MLIVDSFCACEGMQASLSDPYPQIMLDKCLCSASLDIHISHPISPIIHAPEEEIMLGPACWLWDYLRRSGMRGFFLPLSGGIDSCTSALIVASMCRLICQKLENEDSAVINDVMRITGRIPNDARELAGSLSFVHVIWPVPILRRRPNKGLRNWQMKLEAYIWKTTSLGSPIL
eukprot:Partr_v1_DN27880_c1_g1_i1_m23150 putative glutamine-dependent NAD